jgi:hypothetical protein
MANHMIGKFQELRKRAERLKAELSEAEKQLAEAVRSCPHQWNDPVYDPIRTKAYTIPSDPVGTMGVDWRPACHIPATETKRWRRVCFLCGEIQYTTNTKDETIQHPEFYD